MKMEDLGFTEEDFEAIKRDIEERDKKKTEELEKEKRQREQKERLYEYLEMQSDPILTDEEIEEIVEEGIDKFEMKRRQRERVARDLAIQQIINARSVISKL